MLRREPVEPSHVIGTQQRVVRVVYQSKVIVGVRASQDCGFPRRFELLKRLLADYPQHTESRLAVRAHHMSQHALVEQGLQRVEERYPVIAHHRFRGLDRKVAHKDAQPRQ